LTATIVGQAFLEKEWTAVLFPLEQEHSTRFRVKDAEGHLILGAAASDSRSSEQSVVVRNVLDARFPWVLETTPADPDTNVARLSVRRALLLASLAIAVLLIGAVFGGYSITRALTRELKVARLQSDFVAAVSHEFRTPLASFRHMTEMLADGRITDEARRQTYYEALRSESERLGQLVENILDFERMESGTYEYRFQPFAPDELVRSVAKDFAESVRTRGFHVEATITGSLPRIRGDWDALRLALWNLLDNAVKYSPSSRTIWIETATDKDGVSTRVRDQGVGIPAGEQKEIFNKFVRANSAKAAGIKGAGMGLAVARQIVAAHGGEIHLASAPGQGSTFTVFLPAIKDHS
jgi:signal transduction histidine kinase